MAVLAHQTINCEGAVVTYAAASASGDSTVATERIWLEVVNASGGTRTVTVDGSGDDVVATVDDGDTAMIGPLSAGAVGNGDGLVTWTYDSHTSVTVAVVELAPTTDLSTASPYRTVTGTVGADTVRVQGPRASSSVPLLVWCHSGGADESQPWTFVNVPGYPLWTEIWASLLGDGWAIASSTMGDAALDGYGMGNPASVAAVDALIGWVDTIWTVTDIVLVGCSMGGLTALNYIADGSYDSRLRGMVGTGAACDLAEIVALGTVAGLDFPALVDTAWGVENPPSYATQTANGDPILRTASLYDGLRYRFYGSPDDDLADSDDHGNAMATHINTASPTACTFVEGSGEHIGAGFYPDPPAYGWDLASNWKTFLDSCIA